MTNNPDIAREPLFIFGMPRSGTSMMRALLGSHPEIAIFPLDLPLWTTFYGTYGGGPLDAPTWRKIVREALTHPKALASQGLPKEADVLVELERREVVCCPDVSATILSLYARRQGCERWGLKVCHNEFYVDAILDWHPDAKIVHLIRDPRDVASSHSAKGWRLSPDRVVTWKQSAAIASYYSRARPESYVAVKYEDLVASPSEVIADVCRRVGLSFVPHMLSMDGHPGWPGRNSSFEVESSGPRVDTSIKSTSVGRYTSVLAPKVLAAVQDIAAAEMAAWAYHPEPVSLPPRDRLDYWWWRAAAGIFSSPAGPLLSARQRRYWSIRRRMTKAAQP